MTSKKPMRVIFTRPSEIITRLSRIPTAKSRFGDSKQFNTHVPCRTLLRASPVDEYSRCNQPSRKRTRCDNNQRKTSIARQPICERRDNQSRQYEKQLDSHRAGCNRERQRDTKHTGKEGNVEEETSERELRFLHSTRPHNGRFLRHRPKRSERHLNYVRFYQSQCPLPKSQGVPKASA